MAAMFKYGRLPPKALRKENRALNSNNVIFFVTVIGHNTTESRSVEALNRLVFI